MNKKVIIFSLILMFFPVIARSNGLDFPYYSDQDPFRIPERLRARVEFWKKIYTQYTTAEIVLHDRDSLEIIYGAVDFTAESNLSERSKRKKIEEEKKNHCNVLKAVALNKVDPDKLPEDKKQYINELLKKFTKESLGDFCETMRGQLGQKDRFIEGLKKSGLYIDKIREIFRSYNLPEELTVLPFVESSYRYEAYSRVGAAGLWQFMRSTGKLFLEINYSIDERRDPIIASVAAAKLLKKNYEELGNWPAAITAYNHGLAGMIRAKNAVNSEEFADIIDEYEGKRFGFASKNFYSEFLAALYIVRDYPHYFGNIKIYDPMEYEIKEISEKITISKLSDRHGWDIKEIVYLNPSLRISILKSKDYLPENYKLKIPLSKVQPVAEGIKVASAKIEEESSLKVILNNDTKKTDEITEGVKENEIISNEKITLIQIKPDETIGHYADWTKTSINEIIKLNNLKTYKKIHVGQQIKISLHNTTLPEFTQRREEFHQSTEEDFFATFKVEETIIYQIKKGDNIWVLCDNYEAPLWLFVKYNKNKNLLKLAAGDKIIVPMISENKDKSIKNMIKNNSDT